MSIFFDAGNVHNAAPNFVEHRFPVICIWTKFTLRVDGVLL